MRAEKPKVDTNTWKVIRDCLLENWHPNDDDPKEALWCCEQLPVRESVELIPYYVMEHTPRFSRKMMEIVRPLLPFGTSWRRQQPDQEGVTRFYPRDCKLVNYP